MPDPPGEFKGVKYGATGMGNLREALRQRTAEPTHAQRRAEKVEERIKRSGSKKALDGLVFFFCTATVIDLVLRLVGQVQAVGQIWWVFYLARWPVAGWFKPDPEVVQLGTFGLNKVDLLAIPLYLIVYWFLLQVHRVITEDRTYVPK